MRPIIYLLLGCCLLSSSCVIFKKPCKSNDCSFTGDTCIVLDAKNCCKNLNIPHYLKEGAHVSVKILNINPLASTIVATTSADTFNITAPAVFGLADASAQNNSSSAKASTTTAKASFAPSIAKKQQVNQDKIDEARLKYTACYNEVKDNLNKLQMLIHVEPEMKQLLSISIISKENFNRKWGALTDCLDLHCDTNCCCYRDKYLTLLRLIEDNGVCLDSAYAILHTGKSEAKKLKLNGSLKSGKDVLEIKNAELVIAGDPETDFDKSHSAIQAYIKSVVSDSLRKVMDARIQSIVDMCSNKKTLDSFVLCKNLPAVTGDLYKINILVKGVKGDTVWQMPELQFPTYGGFRLNFSTGFGFSTFNLDRDYHMEKIDTARFYIKKNGSKTWIAPSVAAFIHAYCKVKPCCSNMQLAWTFGISANAADVQSARFFFGASWIRGENRRFILSLGATIGAVDRLKGKYTSSSNHPYNYADFTGVQDADLVEKKLGISGFFGISYNLSDKR